MKRYQAIFRAEREGSLPSQEVADAVDGVAWQRKMLSNRSAEQDTCKRKWLFCHFFTLS